MQIISRDIGSIGESFSKYLVESIFFGNAKSVTLYEEYKGALDFKFDYESNIDGNKTLRDIRVQVKTGESFANFITTTNKYTISNVKNEHKEKWVLSKQPVLLIWVDPDNQNKMYWKLFLKNTPIKNTKIPISHYLSPATFFEIDRIMLIKFEKTYKSIPAINIKQKILDSSTYDIIKMTKEYLIKNNGTHQTKIGKVRLSRYSIKHLTRKGRCRSHVRDSLKLYQYILNILKNYTPNDVKTFGTEEKHNQTHTIITRRVLLIYKNVTFNDKNSKQKFIIRLKEIVIFHKDYIKNPFEKIKYDLVLESVYRKSQ